MTKYTDNELRTAKKLIRILPLQVTSRSITLEGNIVWLTRKEFIHVSFKHPELEGYWNFMKNKWTEKSLEESVASMVRALYV